jgi:ferrochelatase
MLGGRSPLLALTEVQARALEAALPEMEAKCFVAMRYWHPFSDEAARAVKAWNPDEVVLLPLYPQFSTTTTGSSLTAWRAAAARAGLAKRTTALCCYHADGGFAAATAAVLRRSLVQMRELVGGAPFRILFSAHGLPESIVKAGDPYQFQVERTVAAVLAALGDTSSDVGELDWMVCFQSRATPQRWIGPSTDEAVEQAGRDGISVLVVPIAFVSEHSETLVELDVEYRELAEKAGVPHYLRVPTQNDDAGFIGSLADLVRDAHGPANQRWRSPRPRGSRWAYDGGGLDARPYRAAASGHLRLRRGAGRQRASVQQGSRGRSECPGLAYDRRTRRASVHWHKHRGDRSARRRGAAEAAASRLARPYQG